MFSYLSLLVLKAKIIKIFKSIEFGDLVFCCVGNSKLYFDGFASDVYNLVKNSNLKYECSKKIFFIKIDSADERIIINTVKIARKKFDNPFIVMIDCAISNGDSSLGAVIVKNKGLIPKSGFRANGNAELIGDASITCVLGKVCNCDYLKKIKMIKNQLKLANAFVERKSARFASQVILESLKSF